MTYILTARIPADNMAAAMACAWQIIGGRAGIEYTIRADQKEEKQDAPEPEWIAQKEAS